MNYKMLFEDIICLNQESLTSILKCVNRRLNYSGYDLITKNNDKWCDVKSGKPIPSETAKFIDELLEMRDRIVGILLDIEKSKLNRIYE